jgi:RsiW-degrading membrane proteinase PrsW (M82 family)
MGLVRHKYLDWLAVRFDVVLVIGFVFLWAGSRLTWEARGGPKPLGLIIGEALLVILALLIITLIVSEATQF